MKKLKLGTPVMGVVFGCALVAAGVLAMLIGFWKTLILVCLFGIGYFLGTIENMGAFIKDKANRIIPDKSAQPINIKNEIARDQGPIMTQEYVFTSEKTDTKAE